MSQKPSQRSPAAVATLARQLAQEFLEREEKYDQLFERALADATACGVDAEHIRRTVFPQGDLHNELRPLLRLEAVESLVDALERAAATAHRTLVDTSQLDSVLSHYRSERDELQRIAARLGLSSRRIADVGGLTPRELFRRRTLAKTAFIGDRACAVYAILAPQMPVQRRRLNLDRSSRAQVYNEAALALAARLVSAAYVRYGVPILRPRDLRSRLQKRQRRRIS